jgi:hypothetical protein
MWHVRGLRCKEKEHIQLPDRRRYAKWRNSRRVLTFAQLSVITLSVGESFGFHRSCGGTTIDFASMIPKSRRVPRRSLRSSGKNLPAAVFQTAADPEIESQGEELYLRDSCCDIATGKNLHSSRRNTTPVWAFNRRVGVEQEVELISDFAVISLWGKFGGLHACAATCSYVVPLPNIFLTRLFSKTRLKRKDFQEILRLPWAQEVSGSNPDAPTNHLHYLSKEKRL